MPTMCIVHKGFRGKRALSSASILGGNLIGLKPAIPYDTIHSTFGAIRKKNKLVKKITILLFGIILLVSCETTKSVVIKSGVQVSNQNSLFFENNRKGELIFNKNNGMNGPVTMISALEYDNLNRETKSYWVHSNLGFYLSEIEYGERQIRNYRYKPKSDINLPYDRETLQNINSRKDFINMEGFANLQNGNRYLSLVENLDSVGNIIEQIFLAENGDTTSFNLYKFDSENKEISFHKRDPKADFWNWDIYKVYDENSNLIQSFRVSTGSLRDTTERYNYYYEGDLLMSKDYYHRESFQNRTSFKYNSEGQLIEELFYEGDEDETKVINTFKYDKRGNLIEEHKIDFRREKDKQKSKTIFTYEYW